MSKDRQAIRELLNSAVAACIERKYDQALMLLREAIVNRNTKMTYGDENAGALIIAIFME